MSIPHDALTTEAFRDITDAMSVFQLRVVTVLVDNEDDLPLNVRQEFRSALADFIFVAGEHMDLDAALTAFEGRASSDEAA